MKKRDFIQLEDKIEDIEDSSPEIIDAKELVEISKYFLTKYEEVKDDDFWVNIDGQEWKERDLNYNRIREIVEELKIKGIISSVVKGAGGHIQFEITKKAEYHQYFEKVKEKVEEMIDDEEDSESSADRLIDSSVLTNIQDNENVNLNIQNAPNSDNVSQNNQNEINKVEFDAKRGLWYDILGFYRLMGQKTNQNQRWGITLISILGTFVTLLDYLKYNFLDTTLSAALSSLFIIVTFGLLGYYFTKKETQCPKCSNKYSVRPQTDIIDLETRYGREEKSDWFKGTRKWECDNEECDYTDLKDKKFYADDYEDL